MSAILEGAECWNWSIAEKVRVSGGRWVGRQLLQAALLNNLAEAVVAACLRDLYATL